MNPQTGQPVLTIDLRAIAANWRDLAARGAPGAVAGVVKADGYGLGAIEVAGALRAAGWPAWRRGWHCAPRSARVR